MGKAMNDDELLAQLNKGIDDDELLEKLNADSPQKSFVSGMVQKTGEKVLKDYASTIGMFGSEVNPIAQYAKNLGIPVPADIAQNAINSIAGNVPDDQPGSSTGNFLGSLASTIPLGAKGIINNTALGALHGLVTAPGGIEERFNNARSEGIGGAIGAILPKALSGLVRGIPASKSAIALMDKGVQPTVGQGADQGNLIGMAVRQIEEASKSMPFLGAIPRWARNRAVKEWRNAVYGQSSIPGKIGSLDEQGYKAIDNLEQGFRAHYDDALSGHQIPLRPALITNIVKHIDNPQLYLRPEDRQFAKNFITDQFSSISQSGSTYAAQDMKAVESALSAQARQFAHSQNANERALAQVFDNTSSTISNYIKNYLPTKAAAMVKELDRHYAVFKRVQRASTALGAEEGKFSPAQLLGAIKQMDPTKDKSAFARGGALLQDMATQSKEVISDTLGESGTAPRSAIINALNMAKGGAEVAAAFNAAPIYGGLAAIGGIGALRPVQKAMLGGYASQQSIADILKRMTPKLASIGMAAGSR
jgi:hypothetical protein